MKQVSCVCWAVCDKRTKKVKNYAGMPMFYTTKYEAGINSDSMFSNSKEYITKGKVVFIAERSNK